MSVYDEFLWKKEIMGLVDDLTQETPTQVFYVKVLTREVSFG